jgi:LacI family transcriptional regulator
MPQSGSPGYKELSQYYEHLIRTGQLKPGQILPKEPELAKMHGVARTTLRRAFSILVRKGLVTKKTWEGTFVAEAGNVKARAQAHVAVVCREAFGPPSSDPDPHFSVYSKASCCYLQIFEAVSKSLSSFGRSFRAYFSDEDEEALERLGESIIEDGDVGVVGIGVSSARAAEALSTLGVPSVFIDSLEGFGFADTVNASNRKGVREATLYLLKTTPGPLAFVGHSRVQSNNLHFHRYQGFLDAHTELGLEFNETYHFSAPTVDAEQGRLLGRKLLKLPQRPTGVMCSDDGLAFGVLDACREDVVGVPSEISVIGFGNSVYCLMTVPGISSVSPDRYRMGAEAIELLEKRLNGDESPPQTVRIPTRLVLRHSTIPAPIPGLADTIVDMYRVDES